MSSSKGKARSNAFLSQDSQQDDDIADGAVPSDTSFRSDAYYENGYGQDPGYRKPPSQSTSYSLPSSPRLHSRGAPVDEEEEKLNDARRFGGSTRSTNSEAWAKEYISRC